MRPDCAPVRRGPSSKLTAAISLLVLSCAAFALCSVATAHPGGVDKTGCHDNRKTGDRHCHEKPAKRRSICDGQPPQTGEDDVLYGRVISVTDGDTFKAKIQGAVFDFRMSDIDAPESDQPFGREATKILEAALKGKDVVMLRVDENTYGRIVVHVWIANLQVNREVVAQGAAWFDAEHAYDNCLYSVEEEAREGKRGLWSLPPEQRVEPWVWREKKREASRL
jgi:endonuclease YncB( thermonuclease family)